MRIRTTVSSFIQSQNSGAGSRKREKSRSRRAGFSRAAAWLGVLIAGAFLFASPLAAQPPAPSAGAASAAPAPSRVLFEVRGAILSPREWAGLGREEVEARIAANCAKAKAAGFNTLFFPARWEGKTLTGSDDPAAGPALFPFDAMSIAVEEAKKQDLRIFAFVPVFQAAPESSGAPARAAWLCRDSAGRAILPPQESFPMPPAYYYSAANPEAQAALRGFLVHLAQTYPQIDGIHLCELRYPGADFISSGEDEARFAGRGNPNRLWRAAWQREQITRFLRDTAVELRAARPELILSASATAYFDRFAYGEELPAFIRSGFQDFYEDPQRWVDDGLVDFILFEDPNRWTFQSMASSDPAENEAFLKRLAALPSSQALLEEWFERLSEPRTAREFVMRLGADAIPVEMTETSRAGAVGLVIRDLEQFETAQLLDRIRDEVFASPAQFPPFQENREKGRAALLGAVKTPEGQPVADAMVWIEGAGPRAVTSADGRFTFTNLRPGEASLVAEFEGAPAVRQTLTLQAGEIARAEIRLGASEAAAGALYFRLLSPESDRSTTSRETAHFLGRCPAGSKVTIAGRPAEVFHTGAFALDHLPLEPGANSIEIAVTGPDGREARRTVEITREIAAAAPGDEIPPSWPLFINEKSLRPNAETRIEPGEPLEVGFRGAPGHVAEFLAPGGRWVRLEEEYKDIYTPTGIYRLNYVHTGAAEIAPATMRFRLRAHPEFVLPENAESKAMQVTLDSRFAIGVYSAERPRLMRVRDGETGYLIGGTHEVRLGGPYLAELPPGTQLRVVGRQGSNYRVRLSPTLSAWIDINEVETLPPSAPMPNLAFTSLNVSGEGDFDLVSIPYPTAVPFSARPARGALGGAAIEVDFWNAHYAQTWISHKATAREVKEVTATPVADAWLRLRIELRSKQLWGYRVEVKDGALRILIRRPPALSPEPGRPLKGLRVGLEAGHGGSNTGAIGVATGTPEKDVNRWLVDLLRGELEQRGAEVIDCRRGDEAISLSRRIQRAEEANAHLFISVHNNAAGTERGFLRVSGTSVYYKWISNHDFAEAIHRRLLEHLDVGDFGNVGNFNYTPIRTTWMPAMLIEGMFMSNPKDEALLLDPEFRRTLTQAAREGVEDFLAGALPPVGNSK